jgi:hypothetical protein
MYTRLKARFITYNIFSSAFNYSTVSKHFKGLMEIFGGHIPARNVYNFDELGIQLGGGRSTGLRKYLFQVKDKANYRIKSDDLELVTILETICADGTATVMPLFVFSGKGAQCSEWYEGVDERIL